MGDPFINIKYKGRPLIRKEKLLLALKNALESANCWREACLHGGRFAQNRVDLEYTTAK
jgi:hypothetical protein